ncbi:MAG: neutral zinc metallopeptidase [Bacteroidota bacterium]
MQWLGKRQSGNVDDRRGISGGALAGGGGIVAVIIYFVSTLLNGGSIDPSQIPSVQTQQQTEMTAEEKKADDERASFVKVVLAETEDVWNKLFQDMGSRYQEPVLVLYRDGVSSACGNASAAVGPFYCPGDQQLYIDLSFYQDMQEKLNAPGDFAMAYVVAHEVGHHIQNLMGTADKVNKLRQVAGSEAEANKLSVMLELQADFYAGVWAHYEDKYKNALDEGDITEAMNAANQIGDDNLQKRSTGQVVPDAFTHGSSAQRMYWFKKGYETGDIKQGNTFESME